MNADSHLQLIIVQQIIVMVVEAKYYLVNYESFSDESCFSSGTSDVFEQCSNNSYVYIYIYIDDDIHQYVIGSS